MDISSVILGIINILTAALMIALAIPLVLGKVKMNAVYGIRTRSAFKSEENWYKINAYGGKQFILWSVPLVLLGIVTFFIPFESFPVLTVFIAFAPLIIIVPAIISWRYGKRISTEDA
ncbi:SdpI family protein [Idiomarina sp. M1R2S28]|uniref:SdpI family protein n=1 Tax=Idiomarina rhizosphaerae TaxID=2961572 RepID=A0A9X2FX70_9GAMM|nr:SdpI family protein [Idiomarina rhizosphaerae]